MINCRLKLYIIHIIIIHAQPLKYSVHPTKIKLNLGKIFTLIYNLYVIIRYTFLLTINFIIVLNLKLKIYTITYAQLM